MAARQQHKRAAKSARGVRSIKPAETASGQPMPGLTPWIDAAGDTASHSPDGVQLAAAQAQTEG